MNVSDDPDRTMDPRTRSIIRQLDSALVLEATRRPPVSERVTFTSEDGVPPDTDTVPPPSLPYPRFDDPLPELGEERYVFSRSPGAIAVTSNTPNNDSAT